MSIANNYTAFIYLSPGPILILLYALKYFFNPMIIVWLPSEFAIVNEYLELDFVLLDRNMIVLFVHTCVAGIKTHSSLQLIGESPIPVIHNHYICRFSQSSLFKKCGSICT